MICSLTCTNPRQSVRLHSQYFILTPLPMRELKESWKNNITVGFVSFCGDGPIDIMALSGRRSAYLGVKY